MIGHKRTFGNTLPSSPGSGGDQGMGGRNQFQLRDASFGEVTLPEQNEAIPPAFPGADQPPANADDSRRLQLSIWVASGNNPYLATATANRVWSLLFGRGIVDPVDNIGDLSNASHPQVLEMLSEQFVASGFDLRELFRTVAYTNAYQRGGVAATEDPMNADAFAGMAVKNLTVEQIFDSLAVALQSPSTMGAPGVTINFAQQRCPPEVPGENGRRDTSRDRIRFRTSANAPHDELAADRWHDQ